MSVNSAAYAEVPDLKTAALGFEGLARKLRKLPSVIGEFGLLNTVRIIYDLKLHQVPRESEITHTNPAVFRRPVTMTTAAADVATALEVGRDRVYELPGRLEERVRGRQIVDLGANIGLSAVYLASRYEDSPVTAVEPHPRNYYYLDHNSRSYDGQITPVHAAVSPVDGTAGLRLPAGMGYNNHSCYQFLSGTEGVSGSLVRAITPESLGSNLQDEVGLLKVDIEGAEKALFESGSIDGLLDASLVLAIETHDRFVPGSTAAVDEAARRSGLLPYENAIDHTRLYARR